MHAYLIIGNDESKIEEKLKFLTNHTAPINFPLQKVDNTHDLVKFLRLTHPTGTHILIQDVDTATPEALNAFLKNLEEPQGGITFLLTAKSEHKILPTIVSRCQVIRIEEKTLSLSKEKKELLQKFLDSNTSCKISFVEQYKKREDAILFLQELLTYLHQKLILGGENKTSTAKISKLVQTTLNNLIANGNTALQLTALIVKLDSLRT